MAASPRGTENNKRLSVGLPLFFHWQGRQNAARAMKSRKRSCLSATLFKGSRSTEPRSGITFSCTQLTTRVAVVAWCLFVLKFRRFFFGVGGIEPRPTSCGYMSDSYLRGCVGTSEVLRQLLDQFLSLLCSVDNSAPLHTRRNWRATASSDACSNVLMPRSYRRMLTYNTSVNIHHR